MGDDYESLPESSPMHHHMIAGSVAGILEHTFVYPIDSVKTRLMYLTPVKEAAYTGVVDGLSKMFKYEGFLKSWRGVTSVIAGAGPAHALYFSTYEKVKNMTYSEKYPSLKNASYVLAGAGATLMHDSIMTPVDAVKQRMQVYGSPYKTSFSCLTSVLRKEGLGALYRAFPTQLSITIPQHSIHVFVYEKLHDSINVNRKYKPEIHIFAGGLAGAVAAFLTTPLDVCKTTINTQTPALLRQLNPSNTIIANQFRISGIITSARAVHRLGGGNRAFFKGAQARVLFSMPGTAISWLVYESFKHALKLSSSSVPVVPEPVMSS